MQTRGTFPALSDGKQKTMKPDAKMHKVMTEFKGGTLRSGSKHGPKVTSRKQAIAIGLHEAEDARTNAGTFHGKGGRMPGMMGKAPVASKAPHNMAARRAIARSKANGGR